MEITNWGACLPQNTFGWQWLLVEELWTPPLFQWGVVASVAVHDKAGAERKHYGEHAAANPFCDIICWKEEKWVHWHHGLNIYLIYTFIHYLIWFQTQRHEDFTHIHTKEPLTIAPWRLDQPNGNSPQCVKSYLSNYALSFNLFNNFSMSRQKLIWPLQQRFLSNI